MRKTILSNEYEAIAEAIVNAAFRVHRNLGPGLLEKVYEVCFCYELQKAGLHVQRQVGVPIVYDGMILGEPLRMDTLVESKVIVELKAVDQMNSVWPAQLLSQLRITQHKLGFLINFNVPLIKDGIRRIIL
jgi:GxxExxY protein